MARVHTCDDCYFRKNGLCAMRPDRICPTFRVVRAGRPEKPQQPQLVERASVGTPEPALVGAAAR